MTIECRRPALIVEGPGDKAAVPRLVREAAQRLGVYDLNILPRQIMNVDLRRLMRDGEIERFVTYAQRQDGADSVLVVLDCEDFEPNIAGTDIQRRILALPLHLKTGIVLFKSEFESLFLCCLRQVAEQHPDYDWIDDRIDVSGDAEAIRDAKGRISYAMKERSYKPTGDQERFISGLNYEALRHRSPSFVRFERTLAWLLSGPTHEVMAHFETSGS